MKKDYGNSDILTDLNNENFLKEEYQKYLDENPNANFIMMDFKKFKSINDNYGHDIGDKYLVVFARILDSSFDDSLVVRLHGDEFCILTKYSYEEILKIVNLCNRKIDMIVEAGTIPSKFEFNAGVTPAEHGIDSTRAKADYMMYYAKKNNNNIQFFDSAIWNIKEQEDKFVADVIDDLNSNSYLYCKRGIHDINSKKIIMNEILTKGSNGISIFSDLNYDMLRENGILKRIDIHNVEFLLSKINKTNNDKILLNIDYKSLLSRKSLIEDMQILIDIKGIKTSDIVLSINISDMPNDAINVLIPMIRTLRMLGFKICLDRYSCLTSDAIWENTFIDYVRYDRDYWKYSMNNKKTCALLTSKIKLFKEYSGVKSIFASISNEDEYDHIANLNSLINGRNGILVSGDYLSEEVKIKIK